MSRTHAMGRRQFLCILAAGGAAGLVAKGAWDTLVISPQAVTETRLLMGTLVNLTVITDDREAACAAIRACLDRMSALEAAFSRFQPQSELSRLNAAGRLETAGEPLLDLLRQAQSLSDLSGGAFDITVKPLVELYRQHAEKSALPPADAVRDALRLVDYRHVAVDGRSVAFTLPDMQITLDGIAKGYVVDVGVEVLRRHGLSNILVEAGGDLMASGSKAPNTPWTVGIESPRKTHSGFMATFGLENRAVATSGDYMQPFTVDFSEHHILDPRRGHSAPELSSATVIAPTATLADALATTCMVLGAQASLNLLERLPGCEAYLVTKDLRVVKSSRIET